jgi:DNA polymerase III epsilon subunit-like protein
MKYIAADFETGGLYPRYHAPVSLAVVLMENGEQIGEPFYEKFPLMTELAYTPRALEVNGESYQSISGRTKSELAIMQELEIWALKHEASFLQIVAHNSEFDQGFYQSCVGRTKQDPLQGGWCCSMRLARRYPKISGGVTQTKFTLDATCNRFGMARSLQAHDALEDAVLAGKAYWALLQMRESQ